MTQSPAITDKARNTLKKLASPAILFYALPWLMILLTIGTVSQKYLGLYKAQAMFFSGWVLWLGGIPLPGAYLTLGVITLSLLAKFLLYSPWEKHRIGTILTHLGVLVLLIGGIVTALTQKEGYLLLGEGKTLSSISSYHDRVLVIEKNGAPYRSINFENIFAAKRLPKDTALPFDFRISSACRNCRPEARDDDQENLHGLAAQITLTDAPEEKETEANLSGLEFTINGTKGDGDGHYLVMEEIPHKPAITINKDTYEFSMGRSQSALPFIVTLNDFTQDLHPGTDMARGFSSNVTVKDGDVEWPYLIEMNEPLRYKGYTFYQSSFSIRPDGEYSILSVVQNKGRVLPYIASAIIFFGLCLQLFISMKTKGRKSA